MQKNMQARYRSSEADPDQKELLKKKKQLEEEFQEFLKRGNQHRKGPKEAAKRDLRDVGLKSILDDFRKDNKNKESRYYTLSTKAHKPNSNSNHGRSTFASTFSFGFRQNANSSQFRETARLTNGFNLAANEKSKYFPSAVAQDSEMVEIQIESIQQNIANITDEQDNMMNYQETLVMMQTRLQEDIEFIRKQLHDMQEEAKTINRQAEQFDSINTSSHFMQINLKSKLNIVKSKAHRNQVEMASMMHEAQTDLEQERQQSEQMKQEILRFAVESEELNREVQTQQVELGYLTEEEQEMAARTEAVKKLAKKYFIQLIDIDAMVAHYLKGAGGRNAKSCKLTLREFESKYQHGYDTLVENIQSFISQHKTHSGSYETSQRHNLDSLIVKRKQLKKVQEELQLVKELNQERSSPVQVHNKEDMDEKTEDSLGSYNESDIKENQPPQTIKATPNMFDSLKIQIGGNRHREEAIVKLIGYGDSIVIRTVKRLEESIKENYKSAYSSEIGYQLPEILNLASECDQIIVSFQGIVSLGDFLWWDPSSLFDKFGKDSILKVEDFSEEDHILLKSTLEEDKVMGTYLTPGEFISQLDISKHMREPIDDYLCKMKVKGHSNLEKRYEGCLDRFAELLVLIENYTDEGRNMCGSNRKKYAKPVDEQSYTSRNETATVSTYTRPPLGAKRSLSQQNQRDSGLKNRPLLEKLSENDLKAFLKEKEEMIAIYPELKDIGEDGSTTCKGAKTATNFFSKTNGFSAASSHQKPSNRKPKTGNNPIKRRIIHNIDVDTESVVPPRNDRPKSIDYRIKTAPKYSSTRKPKSGAPNSLPRVSPYAQPVANPEERRRRLLRAVE